MTFCCYPHVSGGPAALIALVFHVPIFDDAPVESGCTAEGAVLVDPGGDRSGMVWLLVFIIGESRARYYLTDLIPLQARHVAVEFVVEPFRPSGPYLRTMKISAQ